MNELNLTSVFGWLTGVDWLKITASILLLGIGVFIGYLARRLVYRVSIRFIPQQIASAISRITYYVLVIIFAISALGTLGIDLTGLVIAGGMLGIVLGFALQSVTANLVSGLFLYWERPLKPGDIVDVDGNIGVVEDISIMSTRIRGFNGVLIRVPNEKVFSSVIKNIASNVARRLDLTVSIAYKEDAEKAIEVIKRVVEEHPFILVNPKPMIFVDNLGESSVDIKVFLWTPTSEWFPVKMEILWKIKKALEEAGIEIPFPQRDVWLRSPLEVRIKRE